MTEQQTTYYWKIHFRNDVMGFQKPYEVVAAHLADAVDAAWASLHEQGYDSVHFAVVVVQRLREVGT